MLTLLLIVLKVNEKVPSAIRILVDYETTFFIIGMFSHLAERIITIAEYMCSIVEMAVLKHAVLNFYTLINSRFEKSDVVLL